MMKQRMTQENSTTKKAQMVQMKQTLMVRVNKAKPISENMMEPKVELVSLMQPTIFIPVLETFFKTHFYLKSFYMKQSILMRRSTAVSLPYSGKIPLFLPSVCLSIFPLIYILKDRWIDTRMDIRTDEWKDILTNRQTGGLLICWTNGQTERWIGWT